MFQNEILLLLSYISLHYKYFWSTFLTGVCWWHIGKKVDDTCFYLKRICYWFTGNRPSEQQGNKQSNNTCCQLPNSCYVLYSIYLVWKSIACDMYVDKLMTKWLCHSSPSLIMNAHQCFQVSFDCVFSYKQQNISLYFHLITISCQVTFLESTALKRANKIPLQSFLNTTWIYALDWADHLD